MGSICIWIALVCFVTITDAKLWSKCPAISQYDHHCSHSHQSRSQIYYAMVFIRNAIHVNYNYNKAIRDGKYLARHMPVLGNVHPIKIDILIFFRDVISLLARVVIL